MFRDEDEEPKTILESFLEGLDAKAYDRWPKLYKMLDDLFLNRLECIPSRDEWHRYLSDHGIILVRSKGERYKEQWYKWSKGRFAVARNPAEKSAEELMLVPHKTLEKMIVLGILEKK